MRGHRKGRAWLVTALAVAVAAVLGALVWAGRLSGGDAATAAVLLPSSAPEVAAARNRLAALPVVPRPGPARNYRRVAFGPAWADTDGNGCNQRDDVLLRDLLPSQPYRLGAQGRCDHDVLAGSWLDPYTGRTISLADAKAQAQEVQVDHIVALSVAWRYGADAWSDAKRLAFATDLRELLAVGGDTNDAKGGADASQWRPAPAARCGYAVRYVAVKAAYDLATDATEKRALAAMLDSCD